MDRWTTPNNSPIWHSLNESYPHLDLDTKQKVFQFLQESGIPPTDKIFPWVVETMVNRVAMGRLQSELEASRGQLQQVPDLVGQSVVQAMVNPMQAMQASQSSIDGLTVELRKNSVIEASLRQSGWRGVICALEAIAQHNMLGLTVGAIDLLGMLNTGLIVWIIGYRDRSIIQFNRPSIEQCYEKFATDQDGNGWFSCPNLQLPMN